MATSVITIPPIILQQILSKRHFEIWERLHFETVCKLWKQLMPFDDSYLDILRICEGMYRFIHQLYDSKYCNTYYSDQRLNQFLHEMLVVRRMGHCLTQLVLKRKPNGQSPLFFDLETASKIAENCSKLQYLELTQLKFSTGTLYRLIHSLNLDALQTLKVDMEVNKYQNAPYEFLEFDFLLRRCIQLQELYLRIDLYRFRPSLESIVTVEP